MVSVFYITYTQLFYARLRSDPSMTFRLDFSIKSALVLLVTICVVPASLIAVTLLSYDYWRT